jgi:hypothetical protein
MRPGHARKPRSERDSVSGMALKGYGLVGARRFTGDRKAARRAGYQSRPPKRAAVNRFMANRPECPGAAGAAAARAAVRRRTAPVSPDAPAVSDPAAGRSRRGPGEGISGRSWGVKLQHPAPQGAGAAAAVADMAVRPCHAGRACRRRATGRRCASSASPNDAADRASAAWGRAASGGGRVDLPVSTPGRAAGPGRRPWAAWGPRR